MLIPYHAARIFDCPRFGCYYVQNSITSPELNLFDSFIDLWFMPLFFFIAGGAAKYSLELRNKKQYCLERFKRLFIPLIFGVLVLIPPVGYLGFLSHNKNVHINYYQYYLSFFNISYGNIAGTTGTFSPSHLWFILYLFCFSLITLPFFHYLKTKNGKQLIDKLANYLLQKPKANFLCVIPLTLARMTMPGFLVYYNPFYYILFFILGYFFLMARQFEQSTEKIYRFALSLGLIITFFNLYSRTDVFPLIWGFSFGDVLEQLLLSFNTWCWVIVILNLAKKYLNVKNFLLTYFNQASYPIYIVHMFFVVVIGFYIVQVQAEIMTKFLLITFSSTICILLVYDIFIKRFNLTRILFGMKLKT
ncbi:MAG: acyltransferase family protein [Chroococcidiopsidaceae cyanobacterium CP_BM_RX_35]|nr:acyltransferase family protein [Chroococcidiopsidaceae cyanobacterium CP_BM_RX_35]